MNKLYTLLGALLLTLSVTSCHDDADTFVNYSFNDNLAFAEAENSYAGKFRVLWNGLSQYYTLWDWTGIRSTTPTCHSLRHSTNKRR